MSSITVVSVPLRGSGLKVKYEEVAKNYADLKVSVPLRGSGLKDELQY